MIKFIALTVCFFIFIMLGGQLLHGEVLNGIEGAFLLGSAFIGGGLCVTWLFYGDDR